jgi:hypothetical protein
MKNILSILGAVLITATFWAQSPEKMSYQAVIRDASQNIIVNQSVGIQISVLQGGASGFPVYVETQTPTTNTNGLITLEIGAGNVSLGTFSEIGWLEGPYFIKTETDLEGGSNYTITGVSQLLSVPFALHAKTAESVDNDKVDDADADPINEMNTGVVLNGTDLEVTDGNGTIITDLSSLQDDADNDPTNEIELPETANEGDLLEYNGSDWVAKTPSTTVEKEIILTPRDFNTTSSILFPPGYYITSYVFGNGGSTNESHLDISIPLPSDWDGSPMTLKGYYSGEKADGTFKMMIGSSYIGLGDNSIMSPASTLSLTVDAPTTFYGFSKTLYMGNYNEGDVILRLQISRYDYEYEGLSNPDTNTGLMYLHGVKVIYNAKI